jgi:heptaprenyl diphosphate synthase
MSSARGLAVVEAGCLLALAVVLGLVERAFVPPLPVAGIRLGLANLAIIVALHRLGSRWSLAVSAGRVALVSVASGTLFGPVFAMSLAGALAAWAVMSTLARWSRGVSVVGWSVGGAGAHVSAQLIVAAALTGTTAPLLLAPVSLSLSLATGLVIGAGAHALVSRVDALAGVSGRWVRGVGVDGAPAGR